MQLHSREYGRGTPLVVLHGLFGSLDNWGTMCQRLSAEFHVFALDQRNHGRSPHSPAMDYRLMAGDLREFMDDRAIARTHVLGHSMGGKTAMQFALLHPSRVGRLIVVDIAPRPYERRHDPIFEALLALDLSPFRSRRAVEDALASKIPDQAVRRFLGKSLDRHAAGTFQWRFNLAGLRSNYDSLCGGLAAGSPFHGPTLFVRGERSDHIAASDLPLIRSMFPRGTMAVIAGAGHWVHADAPEIFHTTIRRFCDEII